LSLFSEKRWFLFIGEKWGRFSPPQIKMKIKIHQSLVKEYPKGVFSLNNHFCEYGKKTQTIRWMNMLNNDPNTFLLKKIGVCGFFSFTINGILSTNIKEV